MYLEVEGGCEAGGTSPDDDDAVRHRQSRTLVVLQELTQGSKLQGLGTKRLKAISSHQVEIFLVRSLYGASAFSNSARNYSVDISIT